MRFLPAHTQFGTWPSALTVASLVTLFAGSVASPVSAQSLYTAPDDDAPIIKVAGTESAEIHYLEFVFDRPRLLTIDKEKGGSEKYLLLPFKVTNYTDKNVEYRPDFILVTSTFREYRAEGSQLLYDAIKKKMGRDYLSSAYDLKVGGVPAGEANAKYSVAVWKWEEIDKKADEFSIFVGALTNYPPKLIKNPLFKPEQEGMDKQPEYFQTNRMLKLHFIFPGYPEGRDKSHPTVESMQWVFR